MSVPAAVEIEGLHKGYGDVGARRGDDVRAEAGTVFGLLGPNQKLGGIGWRPLDAAPLRAQHASLERAHPQRRQSTRQRGHSAR